MDIELNDDILFYIFKYLSIVDLINVGNVCSNKWKNVIDYLLDQKTVLKIEEDQVYENIFPCFDIKKADKKSIININETESNLMNDEILEKILTNCTNIKTLIIDGTMIHNQKIYDLFINKCPPNLENVKISLFANENCKKIIKTIGTQCGKSLKNLTLDHANIDDDSLEVLIKNSPNLQRFYLIWPINKLEEKFFSYFHSELKKFHFYSFEIQNSHISALTSAKCKNLKCLSITYGYSHENLWRGAPPKLDISGIFENFTNLKSFGLHCSIINMSDLIHISKLSNIEKLNIEFFNQEYDYIVREIFRNCSKLRKFEIKGANLTDEYFENISENCPLFEFLGIYWLGWPQKSITDKTLASLSKLCNFKGLTLCRQHGITDNGLIKLVKQCQSIDNIRIISCENITSNFINGCIEIAKSNPTRKLTISCPQINFQPNVEIPQNIILV